MCFCVRVCDVGSTSKPAYVHDGKISSAKAPQGRLGNAGIECQHPSLTEGKKEKPCIFHVLNSSKQTNRTAGQGGGLSRLLAALAHRVQGLQRGRPLDARAGLRPASGARGGRADPRHGWDAELLHAAGAASFHQSANAVQADGGKEAAQEELRPSVQLPAHQEV